MDFSQENMIPFNENEKKILATFFRQKMCLFLWVEQTLYINVDVCYIGTCRWAKLNEQYEIAATFNNAANL